MKSLKVFDMFMTFRFCCCVNPAYVAFYVDKTVACCFLFLQPDCSVQSLMYNPMIIQASCTMYSLVAYCKGENESDLQPIIFPISTPLVSEDTEPDVLMGRAGGLIGMLGGLPGGIATLVDVTQLLATMEKALDSELSDDDKDGNDADDTNASQQSGILGSPPLMLPKRSVHTSSRNFLQFAFNHVLASYIQAQLIQRLTMPAIDEPVPPEARLPIASLGGVVSLFDLPLVRPLIAKSSLKSATEQSAALPKSVPQLVSASSAPAAATGDSILGQPPASISWFQSPMAPSSNIAPSQGPAVRPLVGRNFAGASNWPRPPRGSRPAVMHQGGEPRQWTSGSKGRGAGWQWNSGTAGNFHDGQQWDSDWNSYSGQSNVTPMQARRNPIGVPQRPPFRPPPSQHAFPSACGKPPQVC